MVLGCSCRIACRSFQTLSSEWAPGINMYVDCSSGEPCAAEVANPCEVSNQGPCSGTKAGRLVCAQAVGSPAADQLNPHISRALFFKRKKICTYPFSGPALSSELSSASLWPKFQNQIPERGEAEAENILFRVPEDSRSFSVFPGGENQRQGRPQGSGSHTSHRRTGGT